MKSHMDIYTDGSRMNGYGSGWAVLVVENGQPVASMRGRYPKGTSVKMELKAIEAGLQLASFQASFVDLYTDYKAFLDAVSNGSIDVWASNEWRRCPGGRMIQHASIWSRIYPLSRSLNVRFHYIPSRSDNSFHRLVHSMAQEAAIHVF